MDAGTSTDRDQLSPGDNAADVPPWHDIVTLGRHHSYNLLGARLHRGRQHLRLLCNHGTYELALQDCKGGLPSDPDKALSLLQQSDEAICAYCSCDVALVGKPNDLESGAFTVCSHLLCGDCLPQYEVDLKEGRKGSKAECPLCYQMIGLNFVEPKKAGKRQILSSHSPLTLGAMNCFDTAEGYSSKLCVLLQDLESHMHKDKR